MFEISNISIFIDCGFSNEVVAVDAIIRFFNKIIYSLFLKVLKHVWRGSLRFLTQNTVYCYYTCPRYQGKLLYSVLHEFYSTGLHNEMEVVAPSCCTHRT